MAGSAANYCEAAIVAAFRGTPFTVPATLYLLLSTTTIAEDGTGATEPSGNNYARKAVSMNTTTWETTATPGVFRNAIAITTNTASGSWGTISDFALVDAVSGAANYYLYGALDSTVAVASGQAFNFPATNLNCIVT